jgi:hypothetical protein
VLTPPEFLLRLDAFETCRERRNAGIEALMQERLEERLATEFQPLPRANSASSAAFPRG